MTSCTTSDSGMMSQMLASGRKRLAPSVESARMMAGMKAQNMMAKSGSIQMKMPAQPMKPRTR